MLFDDGRDVLVGREVLVGRDVLAGREALVGRDELAGRDTLVVLVVPLFVGRDTLAGLLDDDAGRDTLLPVLPLPLFIAPRWLLLKLPWLT